MHPKFARSLRSLLVPVTIGWLLMFGGVAPSTSAQTVDEELKGDDGTPEGNPVGTIAGLTIVNRLTPSRYPATLKTIRIFFRNTTPLSPVGRQIRLLAFARTPSGSGGINNPTLLVNQPVIVPGVNNAGQFVDYEIPNGPVINSGDFFVGFQQPETTNVPFFWYDQTPPINNLGFASVDGANSFTSNVVIDTNGNSANFMIRAVVSTTQSNPVTTVSAASFSPDGGNAAESIATAFGTGLATGTAVANTTPLPTSLLGTTVRLRDSAGTERTAPLFFVSAGQLNFLIPAGTANGSANLSITSGNNVLSTGTVTINRVAPGIFAANSTGQGVPAANALRLKNGVLTYEPVARLEGNAFVPLPIDLGGTDEQVALVLFGTGIRGRSNLANVSATIGNTAVTVLFADRQGSLVGVDQVNLLLPRSLSGRGDVDVVLIVDGQRSNTVRVNIK